jgi:RNA polymerase sigma factor (sigma-70 family)
MPTDEDLMEPKWFDEFVTRMNPRFYSYFRRWFDDEERAGDLTNDLWKKLLGNDRFSAQVREASIFEDDLISLEKWLWRVAENLRKDEYRKDQVRKRDQGQIEPPQGKDPEDDLERKEKKDCVQQALYNMENEKHRRALELHNEGYSFGDIAEIIGLKQGALGTTLYRARHAFREIFCRICPDLEVCLEYGG